MNLLVVGAALIAASLAFVRWWRVAQREHYLAGSVSVFAGRWARFHGNPILVVLALAGLITSIWWWWGSLITCGAVALFPRCLGLRGRTSKTAWTGRMKRLSVVSGMLVAGLIVIGYWWPVAAATAVMVIPVVTDLTLFLLEPLERSFGNKWVDLAAATLGRSGVRVVGITGSFGKTGTKVITAHLLNAYVPTVASPASFNNRMGLAKAVNEHLVAGTEIFVAEMGTYGPGEIADLVSWIPPEVAVMTAIGPVHLERMKAEARIAEAKREILSRAKVGVISIDHPELARIAAEEADRIRIVTVSSVNPNADVFVGHDTVAVNGQELGRFEIRVHEMNLGCAVGVVVAMGFDVERVVPLLGTIPEVPHRQTVNLSPSGVFIIDDTFNSNPAGAKAALETLSETGEGRRIVVTPGMVELGSIQFIENLTFAQESAAVADTLVIVGETNRKALVEGAQSGGSSVIVKPTREAAVEWVRENLRPGDAVLYENDLPDHYA